MASQHIAYVDHQAISVRDMSDLVAQVESAFDRRQGFTLFTLNLDHLVKRRQVPLFRALYGRATFVTADGWPVVTLARRQEPDIMRTTGADMVVPLCRLAAQRGEPVFLFGSSAKILAAAAVRLYDRCPGLDIVDCVAPPLGFDPLGADGYEALTRIGTSGAKLCFVALGAPKQEIFSDRAFAEYPDIGFVCIGAALDFIAGAERRAPTLLQRCNLEWAWRLLRQPRRLGLRYARCALLFARLCVQTRDLGPAGP